MARRSVRSQMAKQGEPLKKEFIQLYERSGWSQAEVARQLELTRGGVNGIITGPTVPSLATVKLFRLILGATSTPAGAKGAALGAEGWAEPLLEELRKLDIDRRGRVIAALRQLLASMSGR